MIKTKGQNNNPLTPGCLTFLEELKRNNNREWFHAHKSEYDTYRERLILLADEVLAGLKMMDLIETPSGKKALYRIYRDVRFSKDKTPYNTHWSGIFSRAAASRGWRPAGIQAS